MTGVYDAATIIVTCALIVFSFPLLLIAFYRLRLGARRRALLAKLQELSLESEYLKVYHYADWESLAASRAKPSQVRAKFNELFATQFRGDNSWKNYLVPILLTFATMILFALYVVRLALERPTQEEAFSHPVLFAIVGALVFAYPLFVTRYASLSLNPPTILELNGKIWLSVLIGIVSITVIKDVAQPLVAFIASLVPILALEFFKRRVFGEKTTSSTAGEAAAAIEMLQIANYDRDLIGQLNYIGVRSVLELAYENPIRLFVESDPGLVVCIDMVDQANLHLYVPDASTRQELNKLGVRTAIDLMTQIYDELPSRTVGGKPELRFLDLDEPVPAYLEMPLRQLTKTLGLDDLSALRNLLAMMKANPQLQYVFYLWATMSERVDAGFEINERASEAAALRVEAAPASA